MCVCECVCVCVCVCVCECEYVVVHVMNHDTNKLSIHVLDKVVKEKYMYYMSIPANMRNLAVSGGRCEYDSSPLASPGVLGIGLKSMRGPGLVGSFSLAPRNDGSWPNRLRELLLRDFFGGLPSSALFACTRKKASTVGCRIRTA